MGSRLLITGGNIITPRKILEDHSIVIENNKIAGIIPSKITIDNCQSISADGLYVSPGFIDLHVHGGNGSDFMDATVEDIREIIRYHTQGGTTGLLATTASESHLNIMDAIQALDQAHPITGAKLLGIHIEGPYFNYDKRGCHLATAIRDPQPEDYLPMLEATDLIRLMTLAPEIDGADQLIAELSHRGIVASCGHTNASYRQIQKACELGLQHSTHLYCAMSGVIKNGPQREGGVIESTLLMDHLTTEVIADGQHLPAELLKLAVKCKGFDRLAVVTDAQRGAGMPDGIYAFGSKNGTKSIVKNGVATTPDNTGYASSTIQMNQAIRVMRDLADVPLVEAIKMASLVPARIIGVDDQLGSLEVGKIADLVLFNQTIDVHKVIINGKPIESI
ncbi:TPA: N-acetylglucosamine-6-phosphate deacetylase [Candidatus Poribacteria bacterium]|mgnify:FL=1|nr:N-acetylglucosamine-6-phosphate deacetylase [Candidatus Poribacteria bacterium]HCK16379.1 N-acetylglucosamine-6-phosphate deacetylase [Candidatus Poribacteria bacterium]|tara:strand:+ start:1369 stop:2544 length:1176 start_codon:yes stop_codon:yes gene_type:complete